MIEGKTDVNVTSIENPVKKILSRLKNLRNLSRNDNFVENSLFVKLFS